MIAIHQRAARIDGPRHGRGLLQGLIVALCLLCAAAAAPARARWPEAQAWAWYERQPWLVGVNFIPSDAINQLEMWQAATYDPVTIDRELGLAEGAGMNVVRVFLHDLPWQQDAAGFTRRIDDFLAIAARHHIETIFVLFDSCWDPQPRLGPQHPPLPGIHNSGWVQSPGARALVDRRQWPRLQAYVSGVIGAFGHDPRVLAWDLWNEPDNGPGSAYARTDAKDKNRYVAALLPQVYAWARAADPVQPLTSGLYKDDDDWSPQGLSAFERMQVEQSDVVSFHNYQWPEDFERHVRWLQQQHRPLLCTEYMARTVGSTIDGTLPVAQRYHVAAISWGLVDGKTQTRLPWDSWDHPYIRSEPPIWHHDLFHADGTPYRQREIDLLRELTGRGAR
ncbi:MAG: hypothetical protein KGI36_12170 [Burkholderiales bacterium]|nr:hypothetical protein [Burkholderiales bacterium]